MTKVCFGSAFSAWATRRPKHGARFELRECYVAACLFVVCIAASNPSHAAPIEEAAERYRPYMIESIGRALNGAREIRRQIAAGDIGGAKQAWISARAGWERSEVFTAGFVPELDAKIDAWPDATAGFHAIEAKLFGANRLDAATETDALITHLDDLHQKLRDIPLTPQGLLNGTARLVYEVGESKSDGGESRISGTSLDDMRNNVEGIRSAYRTIFAAAIESVDRELAGLIAAKLDKLDSFLTPPDLKQVDIPGLRRTSEEFVVALQGAAPKLGLGRPSLEASQ
jgi:iron uptake system EfeUOB component EfeO/EfeM